MSKTNTFKAAILITGEVGASFRRAMSGAARETNVLGDALNDLKRKSAAVDAALKKRDDILRRQEGYEKLQQKAEQLAEQLRKTKNPSDALIESHRKADAAAQRAATTFAAETTALKKNEAEMRKAGIDTHRLTDEQKRLHAEVEKTNQRLQRVDQLKGSVEKLGSAYGALRRQITSTAIAAASIGAAGYGIYRLAKSSADFAQSAQMAGRALGMTATELEQNRYAALKYGIQIESTDDALNKMIMTTRRAREHLSQEGKAFYRLGLDARSLSLTSPAMEMELIAKSLAKISSERERAELGDIIFGKGNGAKFSAFLADGAENLEKLRREALEVGYATSEQANKAAADAARNFEVFNATMVGARNVIGAELIPAVTDALKSITVFVKQNKTEIASFFRDFGQFVREAVPPLLKVASGVFSVARALLAATKILPGWSKAGIIFAGAAAWVGLFAFRVYQLTAALFGSTTALAGLARGTSVFSVLGQAARFAGVLVRGLWAGLVFVAEAIAAVLGISVGWVVAIGAALVGAAYLVYRYWTPIKKFLVHVFTEPKQALQELWDLMKKVFAWESGATLLRWWRGSGSSATPAGGAGASSAVTLPPNAPAAAPSSQSSLTQHITLSIHPKDGQSAREIAEEVMKLLKKQNKQTERLAVHDGFAFA